ncbi:MAG: hypothetical protein F6K40_05630 [Okeania sp. SIO3I5]|uniref:hypothetical protein n=1 Tax=Okeania sp. SIO3I5 TaxID=2607805 RepID=UPI0013B69CF8|nr:hypothetical protein [Okeania sp. SIO3I5]NEQ35792.1 hypothetical protein [Okeania sp. SIO3I5]
MINLNKAVLVTSIFLPTLAQESGGFSAASLAAANNICREKGYSHAVARPDMSGGVYYFCVK